MPLAVAAFTEASVLIIIIMKRIISSLVVASCGRRRHAACSIQVQARFLASKRRIPRPPGKKNRPNQQAPPRSKRLPPGVFLPEAADSVPLAYLSATASPYVYVATCAVEEYDMNPKSLFVQDESQPNFHADYVSPKDFKHKLPKWRIPEVAFLGRSNVGKSSLVNALLKKDLARCSKQPGRTQQVNYFGMFPSTMVVSPAEAVGFLVDLPGYGFAKAPPDQVKAWQERTQTFLLNRRDAGVLRRLFILIDARRGTSQIDRDIMGWFDEASIPYTIVLTKADRVGRPQIVRFVNDVCMRHHSQMYGEGGGSQGPVVHVTSSRDGYGIPELMTSINAEFIGHREEAPQERDKEPWTDYDEEDGDVDPVEPEDILR